MSFVSVKRHIISSAIVFSFLDKKLGRLLQIWPGARATTDVGEIAYFEGNCPDGWEEYLYAK